jgi:hypothetical protein
LFIEFSKKSPSFSEYDCHQFYEKYLNKSQNENACIGIKSGHYWAKADNKALHEQLFPQNLYISIDDLTDIYKTSVIITNTLKTSLVLCNEEWYMLDINTQLWKKQKEPSFYVITEIRKYIDYSKELYPILKPNYAKKGLSGTVNVASFVREYSNFGYLGLFLGGAIIALVLVFIDKIFLGYENFYYSINLFPIFLFSSSSILTILFSGGWFVFILLFFIFCKSYNQRVCAE